MSSASSRATTPGGFTIRAAVESGKLDAAGYERLVTLAGQTISSDYELAEFLIAVRRHSR